MNRFITVRARILGALTFLGASWAGAFARADETAPLTFDRDLAPIFAARCQPCHFEGGSMYARLPFDESDTIRRLGTKLFTRIKDEKTQTLIRRFLDQRGAPPRPSRSGEKPS